ncbi:death-associated protein 1-like [Limulus polyphemus]|uniref:Death-associated protein 1-like n=1 Tax=Limulus polyphemus TaxID=6850 RepID=A0ABM1B408_LIMPO|nr:death-associated protein 1-like [Limulus polyphemus]
MSSTEENQELKAGHPPAVKVGGMRITQHKPSIHEKLAEPPKKEEEEEEEEEEAQVSKSPPKQQLMISGALARGDSDFPPEAVRAFHEKPTPSKDNRNISNKPAVIHQPRK